MALTDKLTNIANAIREKTGSTRTMNLEEMAATVTNIKIPTALSDLNEDETHRTVTDAEKKTWNNKSNFSGNYDDLKNKPTIPTIPEKLPNPNPLTFTGAVTGSYDGSAPLKVKIPSGGGGSGGNPEWVEVVNTTLVEAATLVTDEYPDATEVIAKMAIPASPTGEDVSTGVNGMTFFGAPLYHVKIINKGFGTLLYAHIIKSNGTAVGISFVPTTSDTTPTFGTVTRSTTPANLVKGNIGAAGATPFSCSIGLPAGTIIQISVR